ncbi:metalloregulator ArsR/SmtB family transcription factor [Leptospira sp. 96542]|nr:metalloregulator ArsR/SmtB family transcription factor [Leptospira sp. 96542]
MVKQKERDLKLDAVFSALSDSTRRKILEELSKKGETSVSDLAIPFSMSLPAISKHLKVLEKAGLISRGKEAQWRPCKLEVKPLELADQWISEYTKQWNDRLDRLETYLEDLQNTDKQTKVNWGSDLKSKKKDT